MGLVSSCREAQTALTHTPGHHPQHEDSIKPQTANGLLQNSLRLPDKLSIWEKKPQHCYEDSTSTRVSIFRKSILSFSDDVYLQTRIFGSFFCLFKQHTVSSNLKVSLEAYDFLKCSLLQFSTVGLQALIRTGSERELFAQLLTYLRDDLQCHKPRLCKGWTCTYTTFPYCWVTPFFIVVYSCQH